MRPLYRLGALFSTVAALTVTGAATAQDSASIAHDATSHAHDTVYYTHDWDSTGHDHAYYMQVRTKYGDGWTIANQTTAGLPVHTFTMVNDTLNGPESLYYENGKLKATGAEWRNGWDGDWTAYFPSGKTMGKATYDHGKQVTANFYHEDGTPDPNIKVFMTESEFPGGDQGWLVFLQQHLRYPRSALRHEAEGKVVIQFVVSPSGDPASFVIHQPSGDVALDKEAMRVLKESGKWTPATELGIRVSSYKRQPIIFKLQ